MLDSNYFCLVNIVYFILTIILSIITILLLKRLSILNLKVSDLTQENEKLLQKLPEKQINPLGTLLTPNTKSFSLVLQKDGTIVDISLSLLNLLGYTKQKIIGKNIYGTLMPPLSKHEPLEVNLITRIFKNPKLYTDYETEFTTSTGDKVYISWTSRLVEDKNGTPTELRSVFFDITQRKRLEEKLQFIASKDPQTKALNRQSLLETGTQELKRSIRYAHPFSVLAFRLLSANTDLSAAATENLVRQIVSLCHKTIRNIDYIGRIGEAEFVLLLPETDKQNIPFLQKRLNTKISEYNKINPKAPILVSFGAAGYTSKIKSIDDLIALALGNIKKRKVK